MVIVDILCCVQNGGISFFFQIAGTAQFTSFSTSYGGGAPTTKRTSTSTRFMGGKKITTKK